MLRTREALGKVICGERHTSSLGVRRIGTSLLVDAGNNFANLEITVLRKFIIPFGDLSLCVTQCRMCTLLTFDTNVFNE